MVTKGNSKVGRVGRKEPRILKNVTGVTGVTVKNTPTYICENIYARIRKKTPIYFLRVER